ncbi:hypothetical protein A2215_00880 [Candidatus Berkelbacteria bacterium RIFOXYA2_FULL_43_10]|uniref:LTD domain-containing protein n=1 Tax=Candidatus Berkelbacteria bacterium RIFOXYA2_FULL_43_10 TaxID=1797472 RepID=A0A1F5EEQ1_9BACT|nr:MAG: hypothetical protein A2215_00880 [Candidatus Berkelbacteria bacterium RIFOXYA2_FULL_43_10]
MRINRIWSAFQVGFLVSATLFLVGATTMASLYDRETSVSNSFTAGVSSDVDVVLNEFVPNPTGDDDALMPDGEWVELYNKGNWPIDVSGWYIYDIDNNGIEINSSRIVGGNTTIFAKGYLVVFRDAGGSFELTNTADQVKLYDDIISSGILIDSFLYTGSVENRSWARVPDGTGSWVGNRTLTQGVTNGL